MVKHVHAVDYHQNEGRRENVKTYYADPPQRPSILMSVNTKKMLKLSDSSPKSPMADSYTKVKKIIH